MKRSFEKGKLLPLYFKKISYSLFTLAILLLILKLTGVLDTNPKLLKSISYNFILIGLLFLIITREKIEDELTLQLRVRSYAMAFISGIVFVIMEPWLNLLFDSNFIIEKSISELMIFMFIMYFITFRMALNNR